MEISFLGHSSFKIKTKTASVVTDPFDSDMVGLKYPTVEADIVTVSHDHSDHNKIEKVSGAKKIIEGAGEYEILGVTILGFASYHDDKKGELRGKNTIYVIEAEGIRLAHLGDLGHELSDDLTEALGDIDVLMIPVGGEFTIGSDQATRIVQNIEPKIIIPMHYQVPGLSPANFAKLGPVDDFLKAAGLSVERLPKLSVKKEELALEEGSKIIILEK